MELFLYFTDLELLDNFEGSWGTVVEGSTSYSYRSPLIDFTMSFIMIVCFFPCIVALQNYEIIWMFRKSKIGQEYLLDRF